jgi:hypothetical protein
MVSVPEWEDGTFWNALEKHDLIDSDGLLMGRAPITCELKRGVGAGMIRITNDAAYVYLHPDLKSGLRFFTFLHEVAHAVLDDAFANLSHRVINPVEELLCDMCAYAWMPELNWSRRTVCGSLVAEMMRITRRLSEDYYRTEVYRLMGVMCTKLPDRAYQAVWSLYNNPQTAREKGLSLFRYVR